MSASSGLSFCASLLRYDIGRGIYLQIAGSGSSLRPQLRHMVYTDSHLRQKKICKKSLAFRYFKTRLFESTRSQRSTLAAVICIGSTLLPAIGASNRLQAFPLSYLTAIILCHGVRLSKRLKLKSNYPVCPSPQPRIIVRSLCLALLLVIAKKYVLLSCRADC
jgi:hypothetical protein